MNRNAKPVARSKRTTRKAATRKSAAGQRPEVFYVASTHWDREWYEPFQHYRFRLVDVIDRTLDLLDNDPDYRTFQLDGQTCVLEDYLAIRPEQRARIERHVQSGALEIGPWYVMPDEFLPAGESLVRNLLRGHQIAESFGKVFKCGFVCDIFGHNAQMPQIFRGFEIDNAVVWRGTNFPDQPALFNWQGVDGSTVLSYAFEDRGYGQYFFEVRVPAANPDGTYNLDEAVAGIRRALAIEQERSPGHVLMLFDSMDHFPPLPGTSALLKHARASGVAIEHGTVGDYFDAVRRQRLKLKTCRGELRDPGVKDGHVIPGVLSSRMALKQANARCEHLLMQWLEPWATFASLLGEEYPENYLDLAWRYLLLNHPHDSICGCSIDQVHRDMQYRFDQCRLIAERATQMALRGVADRTCQPKLENDDDYVVTVFNPTSSDIDDVVDVALPFPRDCKYHYQEFFGYEPVIGFRLYTDRGRELNYQRLDVTKAAPLKTYDRLAGYWGEKCEQVRVAVPLKIPAFGWTTFVCRPTYDRTRHVGTQLVDDHTMDNGRLRVTINPNGTIDLFHNATGHTYHELLTCEDRADIGDGWYHGIAVNDEIFTSRGASADIALLHDGFARTTFRVRITLNVPECFLRDKQVMRRSDRYVPLTITHWLTLRAGAEHLEVRTEVENTARDHRVRVLFPTGLDVDTYLADCPYDVAERKVALRPDSHKLFEPELETKPQYSFTAVNDGKRGLAVLSVGQPESAVRDLPTKPIALTLFRSFARTVAQEGEPEGQMIGPTSHDYWIHPHAGPADRAGLARLGQRLAGGIQCLFTNRTRQTRLEGRPALPATGAWIDSSGGDLVFTTCKRATDGKAVIVRAFNPTDRKVQQRLEFAAPLKAAWRANLLEEPQEKLTKRGKVVTIAAKPREIVTCRLELGTVR